MTELIIADRPPLALYVVPEPRVTPAALSATTT